MAHEVTIVSGRDKRTWKGDAVIVGVVSTADGGLVPDLKFANSGYYDDMAQFLVALALLKHVANTSNESTVHGKAAREAVALLNTLTKIG